MSHTITKRDIKALAKLKRHKHHHLVHKIHKKHRISYKTLFYMKEYGPKSHVATVIIKESIKILILASVISSAGGFQMKNIESTLIQFLPLLILLPALNDMIGDFGTVASSKFTTLLFLGKVKKSWWGTPEVREIIKTMLAVAAISAVYIGALAYVIAVGKGFAFSTVMLAKTVMLSLLATATLTGIVLIISIVCGIWVYKRKEDPNNFLIPITTSLADVCSMFVLAYLAMLLF
ncbi:MAG TPA: magnesium transporter [archaeon]|nr:magnesium transporter [archaeon]